VKIRWFYYIARFFVRVGFNLGTHLVIKGRENVPRKGPLLIAANHLNLVDPPLVSVTIRRKTMFIAKEELFRHKFFGYFIGSFGAFPVDRSHGDIGAIRQALQVLTDEYALVIFPESHRSPNAQLQRGFSGAALIALRSGAPILPIGITGTERIKGKTWFFRRPRVTISIGKPFNLPPVKGKTDKAEMTRLTDLIMEHIADLLPEKYQGYYVKRLKETNVADN
jgi:1-acyl-sn-glycerol-3-phosphate acyltransferase